MFSHCKYTEQRNGESLLDTADQLARLKQRIAAVESRLAQKYGARQSATLPSSSQLELKSSRWFIEQWSNGEVVRNEFGEHFQTERLFARHRLHGSADIGALADLPHNLLNALGDSIPAVAPERWAFLDTETTGLLGTPGTYAFLIGVGRITREGFALRQFFMREHVEEGSVLAALEAHLNEFDVLITYNGKTYDEPLLEARYRFASRAAPFSRLHHVDLLHGARRLWKLRLDDCRLVQLEEQILGVHREGDLPGELIPHVYFDYLRSREAQRLVPIFHHNAIDILTLACLTAIVPAAFSTTCAESLSRLGIKRGEDLLGIARWLLASGDQERALAFFNRAVQAGLPDALLFRSLWDIALLEKKLGRLDRASHIFTDLAACKNEYRLSALEELAKYQEHRERNPLLALEFTNQALQHGDSPALQRRKARLELRLAKAAAASQ